MNRLAIRVITGIALLSLIIIFANNQINSARENKSLSFTTGTAPLISSYAELIQDGKVHSFINSEFDKHGFSTASKIELTYYSAFPNPFKSARIKNVVITDLDQTLAYEDYHFIEQVFNKGLFTTLFKLSPKQLKIINGVHRFSYSDLGGISISYTLSAQKNQGGYQLTGEFNTAQPSIKAHGIISAEMTKNGDATYDIEIDNAGYSDENISAKRGTISLTANLNYSQSSQKSITLNGDFKFPSMLWRNIRLQNIIGELESAHPAKSHKIQMNGYTLGEERIEWRSFFGKEKSEPNFKITVIPHDIETLLSFLIANKFIQENTKLPATISAIESPNITFSLLEKDNKQAGNISVTFPDKPVKVIGKFKRNKVTQELQSVYKLAPPKPQPNKTPIAQVEHDMNAKLTLKKKSESLPPTLSWQANSFLKSGSISIPPLKLKLTPFKSKYNHAADIKESIPLNFTLPYHDKHSGSITLDTTNLVSPRIENIKYDIFDGSISLSNKIPLSSDIHALPATLPIYIEHINMQKLLNALGFDDIKISGSLVGNIPLVKTRDAKGYMLSKAILQSEQAGTIKVPSAIVRKLFPQAEYDTEKMVRALSHYQYDFFEIRLNPDAKGAVLVTLRASGKNPQYVKNAEDFINIDLQIETELLPLLSAIVN